MISDVDATSAMVYKDIYPQIVIEWQWVSLVLKAFDRHTESPGSILQMVTMSWPLQINYSHMKKSGVL